MRCKNCGSENDDNLYICQNCGSPLYDEEDNITEEANPTQTFNTIEEPVRKTSASNQNRGDKTPSDKKKQQQTIIIIVVLAIALIAIIAGIIAFAAHNKNNDEITTDPAGISDITDESTSENTTRQFTTERTTESTTSTTTTTTTTTTQASKYTVMLSSTAGGEVEGEGTYEKGQKVTVIARADDEYEFDGWYKNNKKVSGDTNYSFTVKDNVSLKAVFVKVETTQPEVDDLNGLDD